MAMPDRGRVPAATIQRLPIYLRCLLEAQAARRPVINSEGLAQMSGTNAAQVRKDLSHFGELGTRGVGYDVASLAGHLTRLLGIDERRRVAIVGYGRLGSALQSYPGFSERGFEVVAVFDTDPARIGAPAGDLLVRDVAELEPAVAEEAVDIVIITTPAEVAQDVADAAVAGGVRAILDLAPGLLEVREGVAIRYADLALELQILSFHLPTGRP